MNTQQHASMINSDMQSLVEGNTAFALDLYIQLKKEEEEEHPPGPLQGGNLFFSPYSISTALAMTYAGARGKTAQQMADVLHFTLELEPLGQTFAELEAQLKAVQEKGQILLSIANALWAQAGYSFLQEFLDLVIKHYKAKQSYANFANHEAARQEINAWVEQQTNSKIRELIPKGLLDALTRLVLVNAIYFKGNWASRFDKDTTMNAEFWVTPDTSVTVPMMTQEHEFKYADIPQEHLQILELPYEGEDLSMIILLPTEKDGLAALENSLCMEKLDGWLEPLWPQKVMVYIPKFKLNSGFSLAKMFSAMGMPDAFQEGVADFSGMDGTRELHISAVIHKAFVEVHEEGTEAAAATAVVMKGRGISFAPTLTFRADHPFLFLIRDNRSGSLLFLGRVIDPTK